MLTPLSQKLCWPMRYVNITQGSNGEFSHKNVYAVDLAGKDTGADEIFAQGVGTVIEITDTSVTVRYPNVIGQSGTLYKFCDVRFYHQTADRGITVGKKLKKGAVFMHEGKKGNATGNHVHVTVVGTFPDGHTARLMPERMFTLDPAVNLFVRNASKEPVRVF